MTKEELREHCEKQVKACEMWAENKGQNPSGKVYEEHKLILDLIEALEDKSYELWKESYEEEHRRNIRLEEKIKALEQQPSEDCVSRAEVIDELNRLGRNAFKDDTDYDNFFAFVDNLPPVTPTIPSSEDCVSRQAVLEQAKDYGSGTFLIPVNSVKDLSPVTPIQSWIPLVWDEYPTVDSDGNDDYVYAVDYSVPMPKEDEWVLITDENHNVVKVQYDGYDFGDYAREDILAWQPLPKAYEEK